MVLKEQQPPSFLEEMQDYRRHQADHPDDDWSVYGSPLGSYEADFSGVLGGVSIADLIQTRQSPVVLDLMAPSDTLADLFINHLDEVTCKTGIAVSLKDKRELWQLERDEALGITQITGDLIQGSTWKKIQDALGERKVDLIMERGAGGVCGLPLNETLYAAMLSKMWRMLSRENGTMLIQTPSPSALEKYGIRYPEWIQLLNEIVVSNRIAAGIDTQKPHCDFLKIVKTPNSPEELPHLPRR